VNRRTEVGYVSTVRLKGNAGVPSMIAEAIGGACVLNNDVSGGGGRGRLRFRVGVSVWG